MLSKEEYERLESRFADERSFFESKAEEHLFLRQVIAGKTSFAEKEVELFAEYQRDPIGGFDFGSFVEMVEDISGLELKVYDKMAVDTVLNMDVPQENTVRILEKLPEETTQVLDKPLEKYRSVDLFKPIAEACAELDRRVRWCYGLAFLRQAPEAFEELCSEMEPAELEYTRMKMFEQLDAEYAGFGKTLNSFCEQHKFIDRIVDGKATFADTARELIQGFNEILPTRSERRRLPKELEERSKPYMENLVAFTEAVDTLTGEQMEYEFLGFHEVVQSSLWGLTIELVGGKWDVRAFINGEFDRYIALSETLDNKLALYLAPRFVTAQPEVFKEAYAAPHPIEQEYVRDRLVRALGAGAVRNMSEDELLKFLDSLDK